MIQFYIRHLDSDSENEYEYIKEVDNIFDAFEYLELTGENRAPYIRYWIEDTDLVVDYGSWSKYVILRFKSYDAATAYLIKED